MTKTSEYKWEHVHRDMFRPLSHPLILSFLIGSVCQVFSVSLIVIIVAMIENLYTNGGLILSTAIFVCAASSRMSRYSRGSLYARIRGGR